jgi:type IV secretory pathway protease TraF
MYKIITIIAIALLTTTVNAQEKKSKTYNQSRSAKTGRYVTGKEAKSNPSTTYTTKRRR